MLDKIAHLIKGKTAEDIATGFLKRNGLRIISRNKAYKVGELDIIAEDGQSFVFVEVKYRSSSSHGSAAEMVNPKKQGKLRKAALIWIQENDPKMFKACRFDVIAISDNPVSNEKYGQIEWIKNAF